MIPSPSLVYTVRVQLMLHILKLLSKLAWYSIFTSVGMYDYKKNKSSP